MLTQRTRPAKLRSHTTNYAGITTETAHISYRTMTTPGYIWLLFHNERTTNSREFGDFTRDSATS